MSQLTLSKHSTAWFLAILMQLGFLGWMVAAQERALAGGERVVLAVAPVDPFDPLAGRYLSIRVVVERVDPAAVEIVAGGDVSAADASVPLGRYFGHEAALELATEGTPRSARRLLIGDAVAQARSPFLKSRVRWSNDSWLQLDLGLDRYYIPGNAQDPTQWWQRETRRPELTLAVRVAADGRSATEELLVDGVPFPEWNRNQMRGK